MQPDSSNIETARNCNDTSTERRKILVLHGDRQTGGLLLGRLSSLKRKLLKSQQEQQQHRRRKHDSKTGKRLSSFPSSHLNNQIELVAPDGPYPSIHNDDGLVSEGKISSSPGKGAGENNLMRTWWHRVGNEYGGLEDSIQMLHDVWNSSSTFEGVLGFSRGARLAHLIATLHQISDGVYFPNLQYVIICGGYGNHPMPSNFPPPESLSTIRQEDIDHIIEGTLSPLNIKSMHIMGKKDRLIPIESSKALLSSYVNPIVHEHDGGHHVPMRAADVRAMMTFIDESFSPEIEVITDDSKKIAAIMEEEENESKKVNIPDTEHSEIQADECESMSLIFPDEFQLLSRMVEGRYTYPITYSIQLKPSQEEISMMNPDDTRLWPKDNVSLAVEYSIGYPDTLPIFSLHHDMNLLDFKLKQIKGCLDAVKSIAQSELHMPCVMSCVYAARDFFESGGLESCLNHSNNEVNENCQEETLLLSSKEERDDELLTQSLKPVLLEQIHKCKLEGLQIADSVLENMSTTNKKTASDGNLIEFNDARIGKGGSWKYKLGLVGKPSAGKSTLFNAATAFARQKGGNGKSDEDGLAIGGATMAPHPFTTIDPNIGYCLVPAPKGLCPEDEEIDKHGLSSNVGCTHGRDSSNRRLIPVILKDVAGLVPGAYQGRGRGNKFLDDLTDADVLIHVVDASGSADTEGNTVTIETENNSNLGSNPLDDLAWVQNELVQWIALNLKTKWGIIVKKGSDKLANMFSGYKQNQAFVWSVLLAVEQFMFQHEGRDHALDNLGDWHEGDLYRLVTAFLGSRFPIALALNKSDIATAKQNCEKITSALPFHGAHVATSMCAREEMNFVQQYIQATIAPRKKQMKKSVVPSSVWNCLQSAMTLRSPVLVFPVSSMDTYESLPGMNNFATRDSSLPNVGMISCLIAAGGCAPTLWDIDSNTYIINSEKNKCKILRDTLCMKPGSTIEDVFESLKNMGALEGEFVRAEAAGKIGEKQKLAKKDDFVGIHNRILKIMTTKRREWQKNIP